MAIASVNTDIDIHFSKNNFTNDVSLVRDTNSIRQSLINLILTIPGEKPFERRFGTRINDSLFDNFNYVDSINTISEIEKTIKKFEPRVEVEKVIINDIPINDITPVVSGHPETAAKSFVSDTNQLYIYISYFLVKGSAVASSTVDSINIAVTKVR